MSNNDQELIFIRRTKQVSPEDLSKIFPWYDDGANVHPWKNDLRAHLRALENPLQEITHLNVAARMREVRAAEKKYGDSARVAHLRQYIADNGGECQECLEMYEKALRHINPTLFKE